MKHLLPVLLLLMVLFTARIKVMAQTDSHAYFTLDDNRELPFVLTAEEAQENSFRYQFAFESHWKGSQVFARFSSMPGSYTFLINQFNFGKVEDGEALAAFNITPFLRPGKNSLNLVFDTANGSVPDRFSVSTLCFREAVHIRDVRITSYPIPDRPASLVRIHLHLKSYLKGGKLNRTLALAVADSRGQYIFNEKKTLNFPLAFGQETEISFDFTIEDPVVWEPGHPDLYTAKLHLLKNGMLRGELLESSFGIRKAEYVDSLFVINEDTITPVFADPQQLQSLFSLDDDQILSLFEENNYTAILADTVLPVRIMNLFDRYGIIVLRKSKLIGEPEFLQDFNRPSVIPWR